MTAASLGCYAGAVVLLGLRRGRVSTRADGGQGLVEYALIIAVIAVAVIVAMIFLRDRLSNLFSDIANNVT